MNGIDAALGLPENSGVKIVARERFDPAYFSVFAQVENIKAANPQALIAWTTGAPVAKIFKGVIQAGLDVPVGTTDGNMTYAQMTQYANFLPKRLFMPAGRWATHGSNARQTPAVRSAQERWEAAHRTAGIEPDVASAHPWDPLMILVDALRELGPHATPGQLRDRLAHLKGYAGINGVYDFEGRPQRGLAFEDAVVTTWDPGKKAWIPVSGAAGRPLE